MTEFTERMRNLEAQRRKAEERKKRLVELYLDQAVDKGFFQTESRRLRDEITQLERELKKLEGLAITPEETVARSHTIQKLYTIYKVKLERTSNDVKRQIMLTFVKQVVVRGEELEIEVALHPVDPFAGQPIRRLSRKETFSVFLKTKLVSKSEIYRDKGLQKNFVGHKSPRA